MPEAVIVATARTPIGRAFKGSLTDVRPDDLAATIVRAALDKVPGARPRDARRPLCSAAPSRGASRASNMARRGRGAAGLDHAARRDGQPVLRLVACRPADGLPRDQGRRGRRLRLGRRRVRVALPGVRRGRRRREDVPQPAVRRRPGPAAQATAASNETWHDPRERRACCPTSTSRWARPRRTSPPRAASRRADQDEFGVALQNLRREGHRRRLLRRARSRRSRRPTARSCRADDGPRAGRHARGRRRAASRCSASRARSPPATAARSTTARRRVVIMSDTRAAELGLTPLARIVATGVSGAVARDHGPRPGRGVAAGAGPRRHDDRRHGPGRDQRGVRRAGDPVVPRPRHRPRQAQRARRRHRARPPVRHRPAPGSRPPCSTGCRPATRQFGLETMCVGGGQGMAIIFERLA